MSADDPKSCSKCVHWALPAQNIHCNTCKNGSSFFDVSVPMPPTGPAVLWALNTETKEVLRFMFSGKGCLVTKERPHDHGMDGSIRHYATSYMQHEADAWNEYINLDPPWVRMTNGTQGGHHG